MWHKLAYNSNVLDSIYGGDSPSLENVILGEISFLNISYQARIIFEPGNFPEKIPLRWKERKYNASVITLDISEVTHFQVNITKSIDNISLNIYKDEDEICIYASNEGQLINIRGRWLQIQKVTGFQRDK